MDLLDILLDENCEQISFKNENGEEVLFDQVAVIPKDDKIYAILTPVDEMDGVSDDEAIVFRLDEENGEHVLVLEDDENVAMDIFEEYVKLWEAQYSQEDEEQ